MRPVCTASLRLALIFWCREPYPRAVLVPRSASYSARWRLQYLPSAASGHPGFGHILLARGIKPLDLSCCASAAHCAWLLLPLLPGRWMRSTRRYAERHRAQPALGKRLSLHGHTRRACLTYCLALRHCGSRRVHLLRASIDRACLHCSSIGKCGRPALWTPAFLVREDQSRDSYSTS